MADSALTTLATVFGIGTLCGLLGYFLSVCYLPGYILHWWYLFAERVNMTRFSFMAKPMGLCPPCQTTWIAFAAFAFAYLYWGLHWLWAFPGAAVAVYVLLFAIKTTEPNESAH